MKFLKGISPYVKGILGAIGAGLASLEQALDNDVVSGQEWVSIVRATITAGALVWAIPNGKTDEQKAAETIVKAHAAEVGSKRAR